MANQSVRDVLYDAVRSDLCDFVPGLPGSPDGEFPKLDNTATVEFAQGLSLAKSFVKKFQDEGLATARSVAFDKFLTCNSECAEWYYNPQNEWEETLLGEFRDKIYRFFTKPLTSRLSRRHDNIDWSCLLDWDRIAHFGDVGPGSTLKGSGLSWIEKFSTSPLTASNISLFKKFDWYVLGRSSDWATVEEIRCEDFDRQVHNASRLSFVPKSHAEDRIICIEPSLNMFFQKGIQTLLEDRLESYYGINLGIQPEINRYMAYVGSICQTYSTIDLSSASDRISTKLLQWCIPKTELSYLLATRCENAELTDKDGKSLKIPLAMISSMGNAYTFPLQTAIFAAAVEATYSCLGLKFSAGSASGARDPQGYHYVNAGTYSVFGDDIVCVTEAFDTLTLLLDLLGFRVNDSKSFVSGDFRESCGHDYYCGHNVRGVYCKTLRTHQDAYSLINRLNRWTAHTGICLKKTVSVVRRLSGIQLIYVPPSEADEAGIHYPLEELKGVVKKRDEDIQADTFTYSVWRFKPLGLKVEIRKKHGVVVSYIPNPRWGFSDEATLLSILKGELRGGRLTPRGKGVYTLETASLSHGWDLDREGCPLSERQLARWTRACKANLTN